MCDPTVAERLCEDLARRIIDGRLPPEAKLRQEVMAREFGASQGAIREAFLRLEGQRLVAREPRRGVRVLPLPPSGEHEVTAMRVALEILAVRSLTGRPNARRLVRIENALRAGDRAADAVEWEAANRDFHISLAAAAGMPRLTASISELNVASSRYALAQQRPARWKPRSNHDHARIFEALQSGEIEQTAALLENHLKAAERASLA